MANFEPVSLVETRRELNLNFGDLQLVLDPFLNLNPDNLIKIQI